MTRTEQTEIEGQANDEWAASSQELPTPDDHPKPALWRILVRPRAPKDSVELESGVKILLPDMAKEAEEIGTCVAEVVSVGPIAFCERETGEPWPIDDARVDPGDIIVIARYAGTRITHRGIKYLIINDTEIIATVDDINSVRGIY